MADPKESLVWNIWGKFASPLIDVVTLLLSIKFSAILISRFEKRGIGNIILVLCAYFLMCAGIWLSKKLESRPLNLDAKETRTGTEPEVPEKKARPGKEHKSGENSAWVVAPAWFFTFFVLFMVTESGGIFEKGSKIGARLDEMAHKPLWLLISILVSGVIILLFPLILMKKPRPRIAFNSPAHLVWRTSCVLAVNTMILVTSAFWEWYLKDAEPMEVALGGKIFIFIFAYIIFLLFYAPPRLALLSLERDNLSIISYLTILAVMLWRLMY